MRSLPWHVEEGQSSATRAARPFCARIVRIISAVLIPSVAALVSIIAGSVQAATPEVFVNCLPSGAGTSPVPFKSEQHPSRCVLQGEPETSANQTRLRRAHWSQWGKPSAVAYARIASTRIPEQSGQRSTAGIVGLSRIQPGCGGASYYTRAKVIWGETHHYIIHLSAACDTSP